MKFLYALQQVDSQLQEVEDLKGDLPSIVAGLQARVTEMKTKLKELQNLLKQSKSDRDGADVEILDLAEKVEKYKNQQLNVKSNKQYDALTREIEAAEQRSEKLEKEMDLLEGKMETAKKDIDTLTAQLEEVSSEFDDRQKDLREVNKEHEKEELRLKHEREKLLARLTESDIERYDRIRNAKGGVAVVLVKREACGGCFKRVPPQKILEIRQNSHLYTCEHCGRILVSDSVAEKSVLAS
ncbi:MAG TPA: C4-type zinc ribbon domain-containing protein [Bacteroidota bacterium]|nr:C4-type zinc ribbon domain-containing protein [Bacteroidota bacterium]